MGDTQPRVTCRALHSRQHRNAHCVPHMRNRGSQDHGMGDRWRGNCSKKSKAMWGSRHPCPYFALYSTGRHGNAESSKMAILQGAKRKSDRLRSQVAQVRGTLAQVPRLLAGTQPHNITSCCCRCHCHFSHAQACPQKFLRGGHERGATARAQQGSGSSSGSSNRTVARGEPSFEAASPSSQPTGRGT